MNHLLFSARGLFRKKQNNLLKIVSLGTGLAVGLLLIAKVVFELNYEKFYPDVDRVYNILERVVHEGKSSGYDCVSGGVAPGMKAEIPQVEAATRFTYFTDEAEPFIVSSEKRLKGEFILADEYLFDVLARPVEGGLAREVLSRPMMAMVSESVARKIGPDAVGQTIELESYPGKVLTIGAIFQDIPENSTHCYDVVVSLRSITAFMWDGSEGWEGNDRYYAYVRLTPGTDPATLVEPMLRMQAKYVDVEEMRKAGVDVSYSLTPFSKMHSSDPDIRRVILLLTLLAVVLIAAGILNYVLIVLSSLAGRSREMAIYKCYGAQGSNIAARIFSETFLHLVLALLLAFILTALCRGPVETLLGVSLRGLFSWKSAALLTAVCGAILVLTAWAPARIFARVPVAAAFRNFRKANRLRKLSLLFLQFAGATFLVSLLAVVWLQYDRMVRTNPGYQFENLIWFNAAGVSATQRQAALDRLGELPAVEGIATAETLPYEGISGNYVYDPADDTRTLFHIADLYKADAGYLQVFEIPIIEGRGFAPGDSRNTILVSRSFAERLHEFTGLERAVGQTIPVGGHTDWEQTIVGVYEDFRIGTREYPSVLFYADSPRPALLVKLSRITPEALTQVQDALEKALPGREIELRICKDDFLGMYDDERLFRNTVMTGSLIALLIALIGLVGYLGQEIDRRRAEIAIRKVNGATFSNITALFLGDVLKIAVLAALVGVILAVWASRKWLEGFSAQIPLTPWLFAACALAVLAIVAGVVVLNVLRIAGRNPVDSLKSE